MPVLDLSAPFVVVVRLATSAETQSETARKRFPSVIRRVKPAECIEDDQGEGGEQEEQTVGISRTLSQTFIHKALIIHLSAAHELLSKQ